MEGQEDSELLDLFGESDDHCASSSSLCEMDAMGIDCIQDLLDDKQQVFSPTSSSSSASSQDSPQWLLSPPGGLANNGGGSPTVVATFSRSNSMCSEDNNNSSSSSGGMLCQQQQVPATPCDSLQGDSKSADGSDCSTTFKFPEIFSVHGSMVLDGVSVFSDEESAPETAHGTFLQSQHDPLLGDSHIPVQPPSVELFEF